MIACPNSSTPKIIYSALNKLLDFTKFCSISVKISMKEDLSLLSIRH